MGIFAEMWEQRALIWERRYPLLLALPAPVLYFFLFFGWLPETTKDLMAAVVGVASIAIGFLATAKSIIVSMEGRRSIKVLRATGKYEPLIDYIVFAIRVAFALAVLSAIGILVPPNKYPIPHQKIAVAIWIFLAGLMLAACYRVIDLLTAVLRISDKRP